MSKLESMSDHALRLLALLSQPGASGKRKNDGLVVCVLQGAASLSKDSFPLLVAQELLQSGLAEWCDDTGAQKSVLRLIMRSRLCAISEPGQSVVLPDDVKPDRFRHQHDSLSKTKIVIGNETSTVYSNDSESPLLWMRRRKGKDGAPLINASAFAAGERLRQDYTMANMTPRVTADWSNPSCGSRSGGAGTAHFSDTMIAASQRVDHALIACGPEFSGVLLDLCCFLKGLEQIEREHVWPARSAKVVVNLALARLARHYGFSNEARGRKADGQVYRWSTQVKTGVVTRA